ncbi:hypothetical protein BOX15_Mlig017912g3 [Macrostomum lignano]|uniref:Uncharacterized protein n=1 Tax=Macrostomum lignano TaxID=282301 RepID=A0A267ENX7_9PLAT|nr:hypothetical protein BOX15_Mlig017912g1 [Macrostomum lignano]PAA86120.1 hypothetical protein BOX15_Mlig017912g3 [Macrostomum lignano]
MADEHMSPEDDQQAAGYLYQLAPSSGQSGTDAQPVRAPWLRPDEDALLRALVAAATGTNLPLALRQLRADLEEAYQRAVTKEEVDVDARWRLMCQQMDPAATRETLDEFLQRADDYVRQRGQPCPALALLMAIAYWEAGHLQNGWLPHLRAFWDIAVEKRPERLFVEGDTVHILGWPPSTASAQGLQEADASTNDASTNNAEEPVRPPARGTAARTQRGLSYARRGGRTAGRR